MTNENTPHVIPGRTGLADIIANARRERDLVAAPEGEENEPTRELIPEIGHYKVEGEEDSHSNPDPDQANLAEPEGDNEEDLVTIVVDGEEQRVPRDKVYEQGIRALQKESAADKRLAEASERMKAATEYERRVQQQVETQLRSQQRQENEGEPLSKKQDEEIRAKARTIIDKILDGNEDEAAAALAEAMSGRNNSTPSIDQNQLAQEVTQRVQRDIEVQAGIAALKERYAHIANDRDLWNKTDQETVLVAKEHPDWKPSAVILEAANRVDAWVKKVGGGQQQSSDTPAPSGKVERKRTTEKMRTAGAKLPAEPEKRPPTKSEVVANMRKQRGLPGF